MPTHAATAEIAKAFRPARFEASKVHFSGGWFMKPMPLTTKRITVRNEETIFVKMLASEPWLIGAVAGQKVHGMRCRTTLLTALHSFVKKHATESLAPEQQNRRMATSTTPCRRSR